MDLRRRLAEVFEIDRHPLTLEGRDELAARGYRLERLTFRNGRGEAVRGLLSGPEGDGEAGPALLYIHAHGNRHEIGADELVEGRPALQTPLAPVFAAAGYRVLAIDLPCFGTRSAVSETAASKAALWQGRTLAGQMLGELSSALGWLAQQRDVDAARIGVFGISMGATLGYWLASVDPRIAAIAHLCCFADFAAMIETGAHDLHGPYLTVPGLLTFASNGAIAGLVAPRPQLICIGDLDPLTPPNAVDRAYAEAAAAYAETPQNLILHREAEAGHRETAAMRDRMLAFFEHAFSQGRV
ncbi:dienelactone hydrolase family protein [Stappia sp. F7233]|uniref:Dienelactone hydrolase family protein n=1 Tax=Stappia albiluteola TaxID=2758565 RepID=A0A839AF56_9HYPH|nr:CocE/NonD family hydrolase [Stappia albiluteola]MBA5778251.1 dienelactone hydrolase family protein [Stappia albiluteola]